MAAEEEFTEFITPTRVGVTFGMKLNTGNYTSADISVWEARDVPDDTDPYEVRRIIMEQLQQQVREFATPIQAKAKERKARGRS